MSARRGDGGRGAGGSRAAGGTPQAVSLLDSAGSPHPRAHAWLCAPAHVSARVPACRHTCPPVPSHVSPHTHVCPRRGEARHVQAGARRAPEPHQRGGDAAADPGQRRGAGGRQPQQHQGEGPGLGGSWPQGRPQSTGPCPGVSSGRWSWGVSGVLSPVLGCPHGAGPCPGGPWRVPAGTVLALGRPWGVCPHPEWLRGTPGPHPGTATSPTTRMSPW